MVADLEDCLREFGDKYRCIEGAVEPEYEIIACEGCSIAFVCGEVCGLEADGVGVEVVY